MTVPGGCVAVFTVLAPHNLKPTPEKVEFYDALGDCSRKVSVNGGRIYFGDMNARIGQRYPGEEAYLGDFCFGREAVHKVDVSNRDLLVEFCTSQGLMVANTLLLGLPHQKATYHEPSVLPMSPITVEGFNVLDLLLVPQTMTASIQSFCSDRLVSFASHHFPVNACIDMTIHGTSSQSIVGTTRPNWVALEDPKVKTEFLHSASSVLTISATEELDAEAQYVQVRENT